MSLFVLDTDALTLFAQGHPEVTRRVSEQKAENLAITVLTVDEQLSGWYTRVRKARRSERLALAYAELARSTRFLSRLQILDYTLAAINRYQDLRKRKVKIGRMDLRIAATVLEHGAILVTRNIRDFKRVSDLDIEDWSV